MNCVPTISIVLNITVFQSSLEWPIELQLKIFGFLQLKVQQHPHPIPQKQQLQKLKNHMVYSNHGIQMYNNHGLTFWHRFSVIFLFVIKRKGYKSNLQLKEFLFPVCPGKKGMGAGTHSVCSCCIQSQNWSEMNVRVPPTLSFIVNLRSPRPWNVSTHIQDRSPHLVRSPWEWSYK